MQPRALVPLFDLKSLGSFRRLRCRDFKSAALALEPRAFDTPALDHELTFTSA
jgi:hypothetical protein